MKKFLLASGIALLLSACSAPTEPQLAIAPQPALSSIASIQKKAISLASQDLRSAQFVALIDDGRSNVQPIHASTNVRAVLEDALSRQFNSQGFTNNPESSNKVRLDLLESLVKVQHSMLSHNMIADVQLQIVAESDSKKYVKRYSGKATSEGSGNASPKEMAAMLNNLLEAVLRDIAADKQLMIFMNENFA